MASYQFNPINILDSSEATGVGSGGSLTLGGGASIGKNMYIGGNLSVSGTTTAFTDNIIVLNQNPTSSVDTGILFQRYSSDISNDNNYSALVYSETTDEFQFGYATEDTRGNMSLNTLVALRAKAATFTTGGLAATFNSNTIGNIITTGGNVGIGTSTPIKSLDVSGDINLSGSIYKNGELYLIGGGGGGGGGGGSQWTSVLNDIYYTLGNVGIGTILPAFTLDVLGTINGTTYTGSNMALSGTISAGKLLSTNATVTNISSGTLNLSTGLTAASAQITNATATNISSGTLNLSTGITTASAQITNSNVTTLTAGTLLATTSVAATGTSNTIGSIFTTGGNVGINTSAPVNTLDVNGQITARSAVIAQSVAAGSRAWFASDNGTNCGWSFGLDTDNAFRFKGGAAGGSTFASATQRVTITSRGNVGIGNTGPSTLLDVSGTGRFSSSITSGAIRLSTGSLNGIGFGTASYLYDDGQMHFWTDDNMYFDVGGSSTAGTIRMAIGSTGNVGVNTSNPGYKFTVSSNSGTSAFFNPTGAGDQFLIYANAAGGASYFYYNASNAYGTVSDNRVKNTITPINKNDALQFISSITPSEFYLNGDNQHQAGFIAQDILSAAQSPAQKSAIAKWETYVENDSNCPLIGVSDRPVLAYVVSAFQALHEQFTQAQNEIEQLKTRLSNAGIQ
jgi:hypothetical protein